MQSQTVTQFLKKCLFLVSFLGLASFLGAPLEAQPRLSISNGEAAMTRLLIGDHLVVGLTGGSPLEKVTLYLFTGTGTPIASASSVTDAQGILRPTLLWANSGVVGCDWDVASDPKRFRFSSFAEAERALSGQVLEVRAYGKTGILLAAFRLPAIITGAERPYFSDGAGCLRRCFQSGETVHLTIERPLPNADRRRIFIVAGRPQAIPLGEPLVEVRSLEAPRIVSVPASGETATLPIWTPGAGHYGPFDGIVRWVDNPEPIRLPLDLVLWYPAPAHGTGSVGGISISIDGSCRSQSPPPPPPNP